MNEANDSGSTAEGQLARYYKGVIHKLRYYFVGVEGTIFVGVEGLRRNCVNEGKDSGSTAEGQLARLL